MPLEEGKVPPFLRIATVGGTSFALNELGGRPAVIYLWGSFHPSREALRELRAQAGEAGPRLVTISLDAQGPPLAVKYLRHEACRRPGQSDPGGSASWPWLTLIDACALVSRVWDIKRLPATLLVDAGGRLVKRTDRPDAALFEEATKLPNAETPAPWPRVESLEACDPEVELHVQGVGIFLSRRRVDDAAGSLRAALDLDPGNEIIKDQILALTHPDRFYNGTVDTEWVKGQAVHS